MPLERDGEFKLERFHLKTYTADQLKKMMEVIPEDTSLERFQAVLGSGLVHDIFHSDAQIANRLAVRQALGLGPPPLEPIVLIVDYGQTLEQMIAAGRYDWKNEDITAKQFPIEGKGTVEFEAALFYFDKDFSSENVTKQIEEADYEVGEIEHILSFGAYYPEKQRKFPIVGLGSVGEVCGDLCVPCLNWDGSRRCLDLRWWGGGWLARCRFLGVRKKLSKTSVS